MPAGASRQRFFWPPLQFGEPRIEYIDFYGTNIDVRRGGETWLEEVVLGKEEAKNIFSRPKDLASDGQGRLFVTDVDRQVVFVLDLVHHKVRNILSDSGGPLQLGFPGGIDIARDGDVYVVDSGSRWVCVVGRDERSTRRFGGEHLVRPTGIAVDSERGRVYVVDTGAHSVVAFDFAGNYLWTLGQRGEGPGEFNFPLDADVGPDGNLYVLDAMNARVQVFDADGGYLRSFGSRGAAEGRFQMAKALAVSPSGHVYVTDSQANCFNIYSLEGDFLLRVGGTSFVAGAEIAPGGFYLPQGIDVDANETVWVVDSLNRLVHRFQYLNEKYLAAHPILPGQAASPEVMRGFPKDVGK